MRRILVAVISPLLVTATVSGCVWLPPMTPDERAALTAEARSRYEYFSMVLPGASQGQETNAAVFEGIATPEVAETIVRDVQTMIDEDIHIEGAPTTLTFELVDAHDVVDVAAHVCVDLSTAWLVDRGTGEALPVRQSEPVRELIVLFERAEDGDLLVAGEDELDDPERECP